MEQTQPQVTLTIEDRPSDGTMKFLKDWADLVNRHRDKDNPKKGFYLKDMDQTDPLVQVLRREFERKGFDPDKVILTFPQPDPTTETDQPTVFSMRAEYWTADRQPNVLD